MPAHVFVQGRALLRSVRIAFQFLCVYFAVSTCRAFRLLWLCAISVGAGSDGLVGFGVVLFLWLLGHPKILYFVSHCFLF